MVIKRTEHCAFAVLNKSSGKCIAACHRQDGDEDCIGITSKRDPHEGHEVPMGRDLEIGRM
jgi:hypothetical protein